MTRDLQLVTHSLDEHLPALRREFYVERMGVFGSFVHGDQKSHSDVDILVDLSKPISMFRFLDLEDKLTQILGRKVDLVTTKALKSAIKDEILRETVYV